MTVSTEVDHNDYTGNGVTTSFPYTFRIFKEADLAVQVVDLDENVTTLILNTDYTVQGAGAYSGGNVVLATPLTTAWQISISRDLPVTQETDLRNQGKFFAEVHEDAFDKLTMLIQQVRSWFSLALRKPSFIANYYDAQGNYIRNLHDPARPQDAATKNYADSLSEGNTSHTDLLFSRTIRTAESISQLPPVEFRKNKIVGMDDNGNPIMLLPESGSAADVLIELAKPTGAGLVGYGSTTVSEALVKTVKYYGALGDGVSDDSQAFSDAISDNPGGSVRVSSGEYFVKNININNCTLQLDEEALLSCHLGSTDNAISLGSGGHISGGEISVTHTAAPISGNYGNAIRFGDYVASHDIEFKNCSAKNITLNCMDAVKNYWAIEVLGRVSEWNIENIILSGNWGAGIITHWGGDVDPLNPDSSPITYTYHPHNGVIKNVTGNSGVDEIGGYNLVILSAVYNVHVSGIYSDKWDKSIWVTVGDVFNDVTVPDEKALVMTGLVIDGVTIDNPTGATSSPVVLHGVNTVNRTPNAPLFMHNNKCSIKLTDVKINLTNGNSFNSTEAQPKGLVSSYYFGDAEIEFTAIGFDNTDAYIYQDRFSCNLSLAANGSTKLGAYTQGPFKCFQNVKSYRNDNIGNGIRAFFMSRSSSLSSPISVGDTSISVSGFGDVATFPIGTRVYFTDDQFVTVSKTTQIGLSGASIPIVKSSYTYPSGTAISIRNEPSHTKFVGVISGARTGILADYMSSCDISMKFIGNGQYDIAITSSDYGSRITKCDFENGGARGDVGTSKGSVTIAGAKNTIISENNFELGTGNSLPYNVNITTSNSYGVSVINNSFGLSSINNIIVVQQTDSSSAKGKHSIYGNKPISSTSLIAPSSIVGQYVGSVYVAYVPSIPTSGTWNAGDKAFRKGSAVGSPKGWECTATGSPGTWVSIGNL